MMGRGEFAELGGGSGAGNYQPRFLDDEPGIGDFWDDVGDFASDAVATLAPVALAAVGTVLLPGVGTALGGLAGSAISKGLGGGVTGGPLGDVLKIGSGILSGDVTSIVGGGISLGAQGIHALTSGGGGGGGGDGASPPPPLICGFEICRTNSSPQAIDKPGWSLDAAGGFWRYTNGDRMQANVGDSNILTGEVYRGPDAAPIVPQAPVYQRLMSPGAPRSLVATGFRTVLSSPALVAQMKANLAKLAPPPAPTPQYLAAPASPAAKKWSTTQKVAGVGAAGALGYLAWRIANM